MFSFQSILCFTFLQYLHFVTICQGEANECYPLMLTKTNGEFRLTKPSEYDYKTKIAQFQAPKEGQIYRFCTTEEKSDKMYLKEYDTIEPGNETIEDGNLCKLPVYATFLKVYNPGELKNMVWNHNKIELFHAGFMLYNEKEIIETSEIQPQYNKKYFKHVMIVQFELFYDLEIKRTTAAEYQLLSLPIKYFRLMDAHNKSKLFKNKSVFPIPPLFNDVDSPEYIEHFKGKINKKWIKIMSTNSERNPLSLLEFVSYEHFALSVWTIPCIFNHNYIPLWRITKLTWLKVEIYSRIVANNLGDLKVTAGVTETMTLGRGLFKNEVVDKNGFRMPKYFWKVFQYYKDGLTYGIIVVLNCNPFEKTQKNLCETEINCEEHGWMPSNKDYTTGELYCCKMTNSNIKNLNVDFLSLNENPIFNVNNLSHNIVEIRQEYETVISHKQYQFSSGVTKEMVDVPTSRLPTRMEN